jgi:hypothetical protein
MIHLASDLITGSWEACKSTEVVSSVEFCEIKDDYPMRIGRIYLEIN